MNHLGTHLVIHEPTSGTVVLKHSLITPIIKKPSLDPSSFNNYRPISNLSILSKNLRNSRFKTTLFFPDY